jgi:hypothetical protein
MRAGLGADRRQIFASLGIGSPQFPFLSMTSPGFPFNNLPRLRRTEMGNGGAQESWKIFGVGSVGGQALAGIPYLERLHSDPRLLNCSRVWPLSTGFANPTVGADGPLVVHVEVFPSCIEVDWGLNPIRDACQVESLVRLARQRDREGSLLSAFSLPAAIGQSEQAIREVVGEEGWILFKH